MKLLPKIPQNPMKYVAKLPNWPKHVGICWQKSSYPASIYPTRTIRHHGLYIYYPVLENHFFVSETYVLMYGQYSKAIYNQERVMMACIWQSVVGIIPYSFIPYYMPCQSVCLQGQLPNSSSQCAGARGPQPKLYIASTKNTDYTGFLCNIIYGSGKAMVSKCKIEKLFSEHLANVDPFTLSYNILNL